MSPDKTRCKRLLDHFISSKGRISRRVYVLSIFLNISIACFILAMILKIDKEANRAEMLALIFIIYATYSLYFLIIINIKRMRDIGLNPLLQILPISLLILSYGHWKIVALILFISFSFLVFLPSKKEKPQSNL